VRVHNLIGRDLSEVTVEETAFGAVPTGGFSALKDVAILNHNPTVLTRDSSGDIRDRKVIHDTAGPVGAGAFVVALTMDSQGQLRIQVDRDDWRKLFLH